MSLMIENPFGIPNFTLSGSALDVEFPIPAKQSLRFTRDVLGEDFQVLLDLLEPSGPDPTKVMVCADAGLLGAIGNELNQFVEHLHGRHDLRIVTPLRVIPGGESCKRQPDLMHELWDTFNRTDMDRRSYVIVLGGGAVLDAVGYAAATAHRGLRLVRIPTTTLGQADSGVGVKNAINYFDKKNWLGTFAVPWAVINDQRLLEALPDRDFRCGFSEAVKVSLLKNRAAFDYLCENAIAIAERDMDAAAPAIRASILMHLNHITREGDPFEMKIARPLDFGHWSAHKLEPMSRYTIRHGEAVSIGLALDCLYSSKVHGLAPDDAERVITCLTDLRLPVSHPLLEDKQALLDGLEEFRQHLGGELTVTMLAAPGRPLDVHTIDESAMRDAMDELLERDALTDAEENLALL